MQRKLDLESNNVKQEILKSLRRSVEGSDGDGYPPNQKNYRIPIGPNGDLNVARKTADGSQNLKRPPPGGPLS